MHNSRFRKQIMSSKSIILALATLLLYSNNCFIIPMTTVTAQTTTTTNNNDNNAIDKCSTLLMIPFDNESIDKYGETIFTKEQYALDGYSLLASAILAMDHFNKRNPQIISELANEEYKSCNITLSLDPDFGVVASNASPENAAQGLLKAHDEGFGKATEDATTTSSISSCHLMLGPSDSTTASSVITTSNAMHVTTILYNAASSLPINFASSNGHIIRSSFTDQFFASMLIEFIKNVLGRNYLYYISGEQAGTANVFLNLLSTDSILAYDLNIQVGRIGKLPSQQRQQQQQGGGGGGGGASKPPLSNNNETNTTTEKNNMDLQDAKIISAMRTIQDVKTSGIRTIFVSVMEEDSLQAMADAADELGILDDSTYLWLFSQETIPFQQLYKFSNQSPSLTKLLTNAGLYQPLDGYLWNPNDRFLNSWLSQGPDLVEQINNVLPTFQNLHLNVAQDSDYFQTREPSPKSTFVYDSVMAGGMSACLAAKSYNDNIKKESNNGNNDNNQRPPNNNGCRPRPGAAGVGGGNPNSSPPNNNTNGRLTPNGGGGGGNLPCPGGMRLQNNNQTESPPGGIRKRKMQQVTENNDNTTEPPLVVDFATEHINAMTRLRFQGASGKFLINSKGDRRPQTLGIGIFNIQYNTTTQLFEPILTHVHTDGSWSSTNRPLFIYKTGLTDIPNVDRVSKPIYTAKYIRIISLLLMSLAITCSILSAIFIWKFRLEQSVKVSQPEFLLMLCFGTFLMPLSILLDSFDEGVGWTSSQLSIACKLGPWFLSLGYTIMYMALFCKLWRINQVLQFRRNIKVSVYQVLGPFAFALVSVIIIMTLWAIISPYTWIREDLDIYPPESVGYCQSNHGIYFTIPLIVVLGSVTFVAFYMAYTTRDVPDDISDAPRVFTTIFTHVEGILIGFPVIILMRTVSRDMYLLGSSIMISSICIASLVFLIFPKMQIIGRKFYNNRNGTTVTTGRSSVRVSGLNFEIKQSREMFDGPSSPFRVGRMMNVDNNNDNEHQSMELYNSSRHFRSGTPNGSYNVGMIVCKVCGNNGQTRYSELQVAGAPPAVRKDDDDDVEKEVGDSAEKAGGSDKNALSSNNDELLLSHLDSIIEHDDNNDISENEDDEKEEDDDDNDNNEKEKVGDAGDGHTSMPEMVSTRGDVIGTHSLVLSQISDTSTVMA